MLFFDYVNDQAIESTPQTISIDIVPLLDKKFRFIRTTPWDRKSHYKIFHAAVDKVWEKASERN